MKFWLRCFTHISVLAFSVCSAENPSWWYDSVTGIFGPSGDLGEHGAPVNAGQLKFVATQAKNHLDSVYALSSSDWDAAYGSAVANPFDFPTGVDPENHKPVNVGQLKEISRGIYNILMAEGLDTRAILRSQGMPQWEQYYPWSMAELENFAPVNIGQLKWVFSFSTGPGAPALPAGFSDADEDGLDQSWEAWFGESSTHADSDEDGVQNIMEMHLRLSPDRSDTDGDGVSDGSDYDPLRPVLQVFQPAS